MEIEPPEPDDLPEEDPMEGEGDDPDSDTVVALRAEQSRLSLSRHWRSRKLG